MKAVRFFKLWSKKRLLTVATATALASSALAIQASSNNSDRFDEIRAGFDGVLRSSRAIYTVVLNTVDYKYSLRGIHSDSDAYRHELDEVHQRSAKRILKLCEVNKGFYVKAGQFVAAVRQVPKEYSSTLSSLQDKAVPCQLNTIKQVLEDNLGHEWSDLFSSFDEKPIAAASIAQVHHAVMKDQREVAVKVQYPGLKYQMKIDIINMDLLSKAITWIFPEYRFDWMISEFERAISLELDFIQEAKNSERTAENLRRFDDKPCIDNGILSWDQVSVERILECIGIRTIKEHGDLLFDGPLGGNFLPSKADTSKELRPLKRFRLYVSETSLDMSALCVRHLFKGVHLVHPKPKGGTSSKVGMGIGVAKALVEVFAEMIFVHGFLHGDPHPGNILVSPEGHDGFSLVLLDHGVYKELDKEFRLEYCQLWKALILQDSKQIELLGENFGVGKYSKYFPIIFTGRTLDSKTVLGTGMSAEEKNKLKLELKSLKMDDISSFMESLPSDFLTILRTDGLLRSIVSKLGASQQIRLFAYTKYAVYGLSRKLEPLTDPTFDSVASQLKATLGYLRLRLFVEFLELLYMVEGFHRSFVSRIKLVLAEALRMFVRISSFSLKK
ncbi:hypothetical protein Sjap_014674 [Stephania japonica]|uniref:ABC1 atypical kinase-like domain-containing protein n=1 Tax=Stephania japonica TaxID=461633 RepID=A0AAP0IJM4_9MAGN